MSFCLQAFLFLLLLLFLLFLLLYLFLLFLLFFLLLLFLPFFLDIIYVLSSHGNEGNIQYMRVVFGHFTIGVLCKVVSVKPHTT